MHLLHHHDRIPWLAWPSMLSLDAVMVAIVWQQLLMRAFCHRGSTWPEVFSLGATVWLIYVADRLLDGARLDLDAPHTLRHGFYLRYCGVFLALWIVILVVNAFVVTHYLPHELLRGGLLLASAILIYGASVHFSPLRSQVIAREPRQSYKWRRIPKEVRVGALFALGVSLSAWTALIVHGESWRDLLPLALTTCVMSVLFGGNCMLVARFEQELDFAQSFPSIITGDPGFCWRATTSFCIVASFALVILPIALLISPLPFSVLITVLISAAGLSVIALHAHRSGSGRLPRESRATFDVRGAWVDAAVWLPPLMILLSGML